MIRKPNIRHSKPHPNYVIVVLLITIQFLYVAGSEPKCVAGKERPFFPNGTLYPELQIINQTRMKPGAKSTSVSDLLKSPLKPVEISEKVRIDVPVERLEIRCSASYKVEWGFEEYPWTNYDTWTGAEVPINRNEEVNSSIIYTATIVLHNIQESAFPKKIPICYSIKDPCIQTSVEVLPGSVNTTLWMDLKFTEGSNYSIQGKPVQDQFGKNQNCTLQLWFDEISQTFYCRETDPLTNSTGKLFVIPCPDPVSCASRVAEHDCPTVNPLPISDCNETNRCVMERSTSYTKKLPGIAVCHSGNPPVHSAAIPYVYGLHSSSAGKAHKRYLQWSDIKPGDLLQLSISDEGTVYTQEKINIICNASYYYFGSGMRFTLFKEDSPSVGADGEASIESGTKEDDDISQAIVSDRAQLKSSVETVSTEEAIVSGSGTTKMPATRSLFKRGFFFQVPGRYKLKCLAPVWNTTEWGQTSKIIIVKESMTPKISGGSKTHNLAYEPAKNLECRAEGIPKPTVVWTRDGRRVPDSVISVTGEENYTSSISVWETLTFPNSEDGIPGNFTCTATNDAGRASVTYIITPPDKDSSKPLWILLAFFISMAVLILLVLYLMWKVRHQRKYIEDLTQEEVEEFLNGRPDYIPFQCDMSTYAYYLPYNQKFEISRESLEIDLTKVLGSGEYGLVLYGLYKNANPVNGSTPVVKPVAIKTTKPISSGKEHFKALLSELKIMAYLEHHANIVNLVGANTQNLRKREVYIAIEYCENGSLLSYLRMNRYACENPLFYAELMNSTRTSSNSAETSFINAPSLPCARGIVPDVQYIKMEDLGSTVMNHRYENVHNIKLSNLVQWSLDIALGMEFLASKKVIHGDLAARNVMLTKNLRCKIGDFGLSRQLFHYSYYTKTTDTPLPIKWLAIECLQNFQFSVESDVWSYGITLFELFSIGEIPYSSVQLNGEQFLRALKHGMRLSKPPYAPMEVFRLMMKCWRNDRQQRPNFSEIVSFFQTVVDKGEYQNLNF